MIRMDQFHCRALLPLIPAATFTVADTLSRAGLLQVFATGMHLLAEHPASDVQMEPDAHVLSVWQVG